jgi:hypothetical protein
MCLNDKSVSFNFLSNSIYCNLKYTYLRDGSLLFCIPQLNLTFSIIRILYMAINTVLHIFPKRLQVLFSKMHTLHVSAFLFKPSSGVIYIKVEVSHVESNMNPYVVIKLYIPN